MVIAFVVLAIVALIFLFVYNSRLTKKSGQRREAREEPPAPPAAPATPAVPPAESPIPAATAEVRVEEEQRAVVPEVSNQTAIMEAEAEAHRSASEGDRAYREALRKFAGHGPQEEQSLPPAAKQPDSSSDDAYREALRAMMRDQKK
ncbi:hypothetical protein GRF59_22930 [Paenibacillus sp. HJL G12]|uniref:Uncharacterized protein n=1 Tax=Paenibacillus dendrobii TaxID=2691084 RepID=A0A7X3IM39_9BACL|nr:hypothetical protein [Paenibacillus dendrobii]MWV46464.1 hypothetical protein [Paenibacillus dendrobii]